MTPPEQKIFTPAPRPHPAGDIAGWYWKRAARHAALGLTTRGTPRVYTRHDRGLTQRGRPRRDQLSALEILWRAERAQMHVGLVRAEDSYAARMKEAYHG